MGGNEFTEASDVYSFGVILWELVARDSFFSDTNFNAEIENRVKAGKRPAIPKDCYSTYSALIQECWSQSPKERPHFREIVTRLQDFYQNELAKLPNIKPIVYK
jgi:serine/threonine protein kinase